MTFLFTGLFVFTVFLICYAYVIFPSLLSFWAKGKKLKKNSPNLKGVSIVISVYNEAAVIELKLKSILNSGYPIENLEVLIGSDASDDKTVEIIRPYTINYPFIKLFDFTSRRGKPSVVNELVSYAANPIIILTDANVIFEKGVIEKLLTHFGDSEIGLVGSNILNVGLKKDGISIQEKSYIERENLIKYREGVLWGCMMGPFGGCYALRKELYENVPAEFLVDDFYISMKVIGKGFKCINDLEAICYEDVSNDIIQEYRRKSRISAGNYQNLKTFKHFLFRPFSPAGFCFISHKFLRWMTPFLIILSLISLAFLAIQNKIYTYLLAGELLLILTPLIDWAARKSGVHLKFLRFISYFSFMNLALLKGFFRYIKGINSGVWNPTKRQTST